MASVFAVAGLTAVLAWTGYLESDDLEYARAAQHWLAQFPYLAENHWGLRHTIVLPVALGFLIGGVGELALTLPVTIGYLLAAALAFAALSAASDRRTGLAAGVLLALTPLIALSSSVVFTDLVEMLFILASFWSFHAAVRRGGPPGWLILAGVWAGLAWTTRETTAALLVFYGILFLAGYRMPRGRYLWMAAGALLILAADTAYLWCMSGDPFYRYTTSLRGVAGDNPAMAERWETGSGLDRFGSIAAPRAVQPILMLLVNNKFGLLFYLAVPAAVWMSLSSTVRPEDRVLARLLGGLALVWFLTLSYAMPWLWSTPRYQMVTAAAAVMILALWWRRHLCERAPAAAAGLAAVLIASNLGLIYLDNREPLFGERALVAFSRDTAETVYTDPASRRTALFLLEAAGTAERVVAAPPPPGALFVWNPHPHRPIPVADPQRFQPQPGWQAVATAVPERKISAALFRRLGLRAWLPRAIADKFDPPEGTITLYRVP